MPKNVGYGGSRKDSDSLASAKGKNGKSFSGELFSQVEDFFYEFGLMSKPERNDSEKLSDGQKSEKVKPTD